jgi:predicted  nucleic acid-binding Zn-ribbon protein
MTQSVDFIEQKIAKFDADIQATEDILNTIQSEYSEADSFPQQRSLKAQLTTLKSNRQKLLQQGIDTLRAELSHGAH